MDPITLDVIKEHATSVLEAMEAPPTTTSTCFLHCVVIDV